MSGHGGRAGRPPVSVVIPVLNDAAPLSRLLNRLAAYPELDVVVVDGGSDDGSAAVAAEAGCTVLQRSPGRGHQLAAAVEAAAAPWVWMLHADSTPSPEAVRHLLGLGGGAPGWGRFSVSLDPGTPLEIVAATMNLRSRLTGICTGDQGIFVHRKLLAAIGGVPRQSLMEDIELCRRLRRLARPDCRPEHIGTSPRRWRGRGAVVTILAMWRFRLRYWLGADPERLAREYYAP